MPSTESRSIPAPAAWLFTALRWIFAALRSLCLVLVVAWASLVLYYLSVPWAWPRLALALIFAAFGLWALWLARTRRAWLTFAALFLAVVALYISIRPSHDREWRTEVAVMPRAIIDGDRVRLTGVRNFDYRSRDDFTVRYEEREVSLSHLVAVDFFISYWMPGPVGHTFVSFIFDNAPPVCISIETRPEVGEEFAPIASLFKQFELIYVVGDEHDVVGVRASHRDEQVYLYRLQTPTDSERRLFLVYLERINELADRAEFYHLLTNSCTINIVRYANAAGREGRFELRHLLNGLVDEYLHISGRLDTTLPFEELRRRSNITESAQAAADAADFSDRIRASLPGMQP